ncbi:MAG TPA: VOC family protein [Polyangia bacterium]
MMSTTYKPSGYNSVSPYLVVSEAHRMIALLETVFDAKRLRRYDNPDGSIMHAEVRVGDSVIMLGGASETYPPNRLLIHVYVPDVDEVYRRAIAAGCEAEQAPREQPGDPDKRGSFKDFAGNSWAVATQVTR